MRLQHEQLTAEDLRQEEGAKLGASRPKPMPVARRLQATRTAIADASTADLEGVLTRGVWKGMMIFSLIWLAAMLALSVVVYVGFMFLVSIGSAVSG